MEASRTQTRRRVPRRLADRWELDPAFRQQVSVWLGGGFLLSLVACLIVGLLVAGLITGTAAAATGDTLLGGQSGGETINPRFPIQTPGALSADAPPLAATVLPTTTVPPPGQATAIPTPVASATATSIPSGCAAPGAPPALAGGAIADGTNPAPMVAGCAATLLIAAPRHPNAPVSVTLTFGAIGQPGCSVTITNGATDDRGNAAIAFTVPSSCFRGTILTAGDITVGSDSSANANLPATSG